MHRLLLKNLPNFNKATSLLNLNRLPVSYSNLKLAQTLLKTKTQSTSNKQSFIPTHNQQFKLNSSAATIKSIVNSFNPNQIIQFPKSSPLLSYVKTAELKFLKFQKCINTESQKNPDNINLIIKSQSANKYSLLKWIRRIILITFITKILQQEGYRCDYDMNDMMLTIQLDQRPLEQEQGNQQEVESEEEEKEKKRIFRPKRSSIQQSGANKQQRYGTVQEMLLHQMSSSEDFMSVEERLYVKEIQQKRDQRKQNNQKNQQTPTSQKSKKNKASIASHIFKPEQKDRTWQNEQPFSQRNHESNINISKQKGPSEIPQTSQSQSQQTPTTTYNKSQKEQGNQLTEDLTIKNIQNVQSIQPLSENNIQNNFQQQPLHQPPIDTQNSAIIYIQSEKKSPMSKRISNFLQKRGITVQFQSSSAYQSQEYQPTLKIRLCNKLTQCKDINFQAQDKQYRDVFHHINNFLNPPHIINSVEQAKDILSLLQNDESIISSYIPTSSPQFQTHKHKSVFDTFSVRHPPVNLSVAEKEFNQYKYLSSSKKNCFVIVRNEQVAKYLKISTNKIGTPHILFKYDKQLNGKQSQPNCKIDGDFYHSVGNMDRIVQKEKLNSVEKVAHKINLLTERGFTQTNVIEDVHDKIRQLDEQVNGFSFTAQKNENKDKIKPKHKKLFVVKTSDPQSEQQINEILQKLSKLNKHEVSILKTQSQALLKSLRILNNDEYASIRLFDFEGIQQQIINMKPATQKNNYFQRYIPNGPFQIEFLSRWINNLSPFDKAHSEVDKSLNKLQSSYPHDLEAGSEGKAKLVLFYKQGCKGCKLMEELLGHLAELQERLRSGDSQSWRKLKRQICLRYRIQDSQRIAGLQITRFNILNDDPTIQVPQTTPVIYLFNGKKTEKYTIKTQQVFSQLNKMKNGNDEVVHDYMMRELIEEIERNVKRMDNVL